MEGESSDNAANGRRGSRALPSDHLFEVLRQHYGFRDLSLVRDLGGSSSLNLAFSSAGGAYVARLYRPYLDEARLQLIQTVRSGLNSKFVPCAEPIKTRDDLPYVRVGDRLLEVEPFVQTNEKMDSWERLNTGMGWLGKVHSALQGVRCDSNAARPLFANCLQREQTGAGVWKGLQRVRRWGLDAAEIELIKRTEELTDSVLAAETRGPRLSRQLVHGDFWDNNVLFRASEVVLIADFDFMGERPRIDDVALTLYYAISSFRENPLLPESVRRLRRLVDAYDSGLHEPLSASERTALAIEVARQPLWWIGHWLPILDDEGHARRGFGEMHGDVSWALELMRAGEAWQDVFS